jgi:3-methyladenine DNA glycosylase AlkD
MNIAAKDIKKSLIELGNSEIAEHSQRFFKTGKGEYGEGDKFLGIRVPVIRKQVKIYKNVSLGQTFVLLKSPFHEIRLFALLMLVQKFSSGTEKRKIYELYLKNTKYINNWDLVDSSAHYIVGAYLFDKDKQPIYELTKSKNLWERRISIMSTFHFIKCGKFNDILKISEILLDDNEDLIHKAVGWMLREIGNRSISVEEKFLKKFVLKMPRTMLRYAIEKFPERKRKFYLNL